MPRKSTLDPQVKTLLDNLNLDDGGEELLAEPAQDAAQHLCVLLERLTNGRERALRPGMLATWKPGLKIAASPVMVSRWWWSRCWIHRSSTPAMSPGRRISGSRWICCWA